MSRCFVIALALIAIFSSTVFAQSQTNENKDASKLPTIKTFYELTGGYRNDISFTPVAGEMKGHLVILGNRCFIDQEVAVQDGLRAFTINLPTMSARNSADIEFCKVNYVVTLPKEKGFFGFRGVLFSSGANLPPQLGHFSYK